MEAFSQDLRLRILKACDEGCTTAEIAEEFEVSESWVRRFKQRYRETGEITPRPCGGATVVKIIPEKLIKLVEQRPDSTLEELRDGLGIECSISGISMALKRLKITRKKR